MAAGAQSRTPVRISSSETSPERKRRFQLAADLLHESLTAFVLSAADERAARVLAEHQVTVLPAAFFDEFFDAVAAVPNEALVELGRGSRPFTRR
ncbi:MAG TPA: DUF1778 domain-containing protein [Actinomycetes bacterium]|nr:DUF1778 domain-containing protein [Actinomycetes bacterium]